MWFSWFVLQRVYDDLWDGQGVEHAEASQEEGVVGLDVTGKVLESLLQPGLEVSSLLHLGVPDCVLVCSAGLYQAGTWIFSRDF